MSASSWKKGAEKVDEPVEDVAADAVGADMAGRGLLPMLLTVEEALERSCLPSLSKYLSANSPVCSNVRASTLSTI